MTEGTITEGAPIAGVIAATPPLSVWIELPPGTTIEVREEVPGGNANHVYERPIIARFQCDARYLRRLAVTLAEARRSHPYP